jgi:hypothetical protein
MGAGVTRTFPILGEVYASATEARDQVKMACNGRFQNLRVRILPAANASKICLRVNGAVSALTITTTGGGGEAEYNDDTHSVAVNAGDLVNFQCISGVASPTLYFAEVKFIPE